MSLSRAIVTAVALLSVSGCATVPQPLPGTTQAKILSERVSLAEASEARGNLAEALFHWEIAKALAPGDEAIAAHLEHLQRTTAEQARVLRNAGIRDLAKGNLRRACSNLLRALAVRPCDREALEQLREVERKRLERRIAAKVERSRQALGVSAIATEHLYEKEERPATGDGEGGSVGQDIGSQGDRTEQVARQLARAEGHFTRGELDAALQRIRHAEAVAGDDRGLLEMVSEQRKRFADRLYATGVGLHSTYPLRALDYWREALRYDPRHEKAAARIKWLSY